jgi:hypothetical protein
MDQQRIEIVDKCRQTWWANKFFGKCWPKITRFRIACSER